MVEEIARSESVIQLFFVVCLSNCGLATFHSEDTNHRYCIFFLMQVNEDYRNLLFEAVFGKMPTTARML